MGKKTRFIDYKSAIKWFNNDFVKLDKIAQMDSSVWENMKGAGENDVIAEFYVCDCSKREVEFLMKSFEGLIFSFSEVLEKYILCVDHWGTSWDYVHCRVLTYGNEDDMYPRIKSYKELTGQEF